MKKIQQLFILLFICLTVSFTTSLQAQNLVPNASFEVQDTCPMVSQLFLAPPWNSPTPGSPDLFNNSCNGQVGSPRTGVGSAGLFTYSTFPNNREYMQVQLTAPLIAGQAYEVSFYTKRLDSPIAAYSIDRIGAHLSTTPIAITNSTAALTAYEPQIEHTGSFIFGSNYTQVSDIYVASGGEQYLIIGNFRDDATTGTLELNLGGTLRAYNYIDDVSVSPITNVNSSDNGRHVKVFPNPSNGILTLDILHPTPLSELSLEVIDLTGRVVRQEVYGNTAQKILNLSSLSKGMYIIRIFSGGEYFAHKKVSLQ